MKSGNKLVLTAADSKTTYQLDDQQKAQDFLNSPWHKYLNFGEACSAD